jgi:hypothetical protein
MAANFNTITGAYIAPKTVVYLVTFSVAFRFSFLKRAGSVTTSILQNAVAKSSFF